MRDKSIQWTRRIVQTLSVVLFFYLLLATRFRGEYQANEKLDFFFAIDPLVMLGTWISTRSLATASMLALVTLAVTLVLGRVFCGWVCPLGAIHNAFSWLRLKIRKVRPAEDRFSGWQRGKYYLLAGLLVMALFGVHWIGIFDPFAFLYRSMVTAVHPVAQYFVESGSTAVYRADPSVGPLHATSVTEPTYRFLRDHIFVTARPLYRGSTWILVAFLGVVALNLFRARFWCRYICPLGGLLGLVAWRPGLQLVNTDNACTGCGRCTTRCPAAAQPEKPGEWLPTECFECWNCVNACREDAIRFTMNVPVLKKPQAGKLDLSKRALLASGAAGVAGIAAARLTPHAQGKAYNPALIRPPGSHEENEFLKRCLQCGLCMKICPSNALQPALFEAGLEGLGSPVLVPQAGACEFECNLCGQVCPTQAIEKLPIEEKKTTRIGLAMFDRNRCLPWAYKRECMICEEHCPIPDKAIYFQENEVTLRDGTVITIKQPYVDPDKCIGCGLCENVCVFKSKPAVRVTSSNERRHPDNQTILPGGFTSYGGFGGF